MIDATHGLPRLRPVEARLGGVLARPKRLAVGCVVLLAALGWLYIGLMMAGMLGSLAPFGPGMAVFDLLARPGEFDGLGRALQQALCQPAFGAGTAPLGSVWGGADIGLVFVMWCAMALAVMLPSAGPMILTYAEIADAAAAKNQPVVSPLVLAAGYLSVWIGFAALATLLQALLMHLALLGPAMASASSLFSGAIFLAAGAYQFSALKHACVTQCQRPMPFFLVNWTNERRGVFRLGLRQGVYCLGCCWAMMLLMLAVGVMNVVWMVALGIIMTIEKMATTTRFSRAIGVGWLLIGTGLIVSAIAARAA
jgi:predicted metal-binding membrane protein